MTSHASTCLLPLLATLTVVACACGDSGDAVSGASLLDAAVGGPRLGADAAEPDPMDPMDPMLEDLVVSGAQFPLKPAFSPQIRRYSIVAESPASSLKLTALAAPELDVEVAGTTAASGNAVDLSHYSPGSSIDVVVTNAADESRHYTVVYLPSDFPDFRVTTHEPGASSDPIYVATRSREVFFLVKLDENGVPLFYRRAPQSIYDFKQHDNGQLSYAQRFAGDSNCEHIVLDSQFREVERVSSVGLSHTDVHEFKILPNGNYVVLAYELTERDASPYGGSDNQEMRDCILQELSPDREVLFQWNSWDHMSYEESLYGERDYSHLNSVDIDDDGNWLVSSRGMAQVLKIDRATGEVMWRLGGMASDFTFVNDPFGGLCGQHTAARLDNGNILLFDNGQYCWPEMPERGELTRVAEYALDEEAMTAELVWSFERPGAYTVSQGSSQRLENGNTFIGWGVGPDMMATEVDPGGNIVFELEAYSPRGSVVSYRAWRFPDLAAGADDPVGEILNVTDGDVGVGEGDAGMPQDAPTVEELCAASCSAKADALCQGFDEEACNRDCYALGLYRVYYLSCYPQYRAARECEARVEHACPLTDPPPDCVDELSAESQCTI